MSRLSLPEQPGSVPDASVAVLRKRRAMAKALAEKTRAVLESMKDGK